MAFFLINSTDYLKIYNYGIYRFIDEYGDIVRRYISCLCLKSYG